MLWESNFTCIVPQGIHAHHIQLIVRENKKLATKNRNRVLLFFSNFAFLLDCKFKPLRMPWKKTGWQKYGDRIFLLSLPCEANNMWRHCQFNYVRSFLLLQKITIIFFLLPLLGDIKSLKTVFSHSFYGFLYKNNDINH